MKRTFKTRLRAVPSLILACVTRTVNVTCRHTTATRALPPAAMDVVVWMERYTYSTHALFHHNTTAPARRAAVCRAQRGRLRATLRYRHCYLPPIRVRQHRAGPSTTVWPAARTTYLRSLRRHGTPPGATDIPSPRRTTVAAPLPFEHCGSALLLATQTRLCLPCAVRPHACEPPLPA